MTMEILFMAKALLAQGSPSPNQLTLEEQKAGWRLLFDGKTTSGWRGFKKADFPTDKWAARDGCLEKTATGTGDARMCSIMSFIESLRPPGVSMVINTSAA